MLATPALILQGERDPMGSRGTVTGYPLAKSIAIHWLADGNHDLVPRKKSGRSGEENWREAIASAGDFLTR